MRKKMYEKPSVEVVVLKQAGMLKYTKGTPGLLRQRRKKWKNLAK
jgi:hypothetical protein